MVSYGSLPSLPGVASCKIKLPKVVVFALKAGLGIGGAICGAIVDSFGFVSNTVQTENAIFGIRLTSSVIPAITFFVGVIALFFYPISKKLNEHIQDDLAKRRLENN